MHVAESDAVAAGEGFIRRFVSYSLENRFALSGPESSRTTHLFAPDFRRACPGRDQQLNGYATNSRSNRTPSGLSRSVAQLIS